jgi:putative methionine-R-sulfoxide reductase with GAF domain
VEDQRNWVCNLANAASLLWHMYHSLPASVAPGASSVNWAGFYVLDPSAPDKQLILGPFMGKVACQTITLGKGVCGTAAVGKDGSGKGETLLVRDVEKFPGHIACDGQSKSEVVVPIRANGKVSSLTPNTTIRASHKNPSSAKLTGVKVVGVIDIDCAELNGFDGEDQHGLEAIADLLGKSCEW